MAWGEQEFQQALQRAIAEYRADTRQAVRSGRFIRPIHEFCAEELARHGMPADHLVPHPTLGGYLPPSATAMVESAKRRIRGRLRTAQQAALRDDLTRDLDAVAHEARRKRLRVLGGYLEKEIDVCLMVEDTGPLTAISVKSQMSSIAKNAINRFEEYVGDATNLHTRYPMLVLGFLLLVPVVEETYDRPNRRPRELLRRIRALLEQATGREDPWGAPGSYEASALAVVDFDQDPPVVLADFPEPGGSLRIEAFFDRLVALYRRRNQPAG